jgi:cyanate permease
MHPSVDSRAWQLRLPFFYGWIIIAVGFMASAFGVGLTWAAGLLAVPMTAELHWSLSAYFFAVSLRGWLGIGVTPLVGPYLDRPSGARLLTVTGGVLNTIGLALTPLIDREWQFIMLFGILGGVGQAFQGGIWVAIVPKWFVRRRGVAVAISTVGNSVAAVLLPPFVAILTGVGSWRLAWLALGILSLLLGTLPALLLRRQPEDLGLLPDGGAKPPSAMARPEGEPFLSGSVTEGPALRSVQSVTRAEAVRTNAFWILVVGIGIGSLVNNGIPASFAPIFVDRGFPFEVAAGALAWYGLASGAGKMAWGWVVDRVSVRKTMLIVTAFGAVALSSILVAPQIGPYAYAFLSGAYIGAYFFLSQLVWSEYFGRAHVGSISALGRPLGMLAGASGPFLLAFTRDLTGSYDLGIWLNALSAALCFVALLLVRPVRRPA